MTGTPLESFVAEQLQDAVKPIRRLTDEGTKILDKIRDSDRKFDLVDRVTISHLFVHTIAAIDAISVLLEKGAAYAAMTSIRSLMDASVQLVWILHEDAETPRTTVLRGISEKAAPGRRPFP